MWSGGSYYGSGGDYYGSDRQLSESGCAVGTDCADCNAHRLCTSTQCNSACRARGIALGAAMYCLEHQFSDGKCDTNCNNWECGHDDGDCSNEEIFSECRKGHDDPGWAHIKSVPGNRSATGEVFGSNATRAYALVEAKLLKFKPLLFSLDSSSDTWRLTVDAELRLRWSDSRLKTVACKNVLPEILSLVVGDDNRAQRQQAESYKSMVWFPTVQLGGNTIDYTIEPSSNTKTVVKADFSTETGDGAAWDTDPSLGGWAAAGLPTANCVDCATYTASVVSSFAAAPKMVFAFFPFDVQEFRFTLVVGKARIWNCAALMADPNRPNVQTQDFLPSTGEWSAQGITAKHPEDETGTPDFSRCEVIIEARRNAMIFILKQILPSVIVVYAGLCALYISAADHTGDRVALILVSVLILMVNFQTDLNLGKLTYLTWWDIFNLVSMFLLGVALIEAIYEHICLTKDELEWSITLNKVARVAILAGYYPLLLIWVLIIGLSGTWGSVAAWVILVVGNVLITLWSSRSIRRRLHAGELNRIETVEKLKTVDVASSEFASLLHDAFEALDIDNSGSLDMDEARDMMKLVLHDKEGNTSLTPAQFAHAMLEVRKFRDHEGVLSESAFTDALIHVLAFVGMITDGDDVSKRISDLHQLPSGRSGSSALKAEKKARGEPSDLGNTPVVTIKQVAPGP
jgi:hypothetical protein